jgi:lysophospholipase L1-like esterase
VKSVLCFGDSNTWGFIPGTGGRFPRNVRWPGVLQQELGDDYYVVEEGLSGRTAIWDSPFEDYLNGKPYFIPCLQSHRPLDLVLIMLGTNDVGHQYGLSTSEVAGGIGTLVRLARRSLAGPDDTPPQVLVVAPPAMRPSELWDQYGLEAAAKTDAFPQQFQLMAESYAASFFDAGSVIESSEADGVHFDAAAHRTLALALSRVVRTILAM